MGLRFIAMLLYTPVACGMAVFRPYWGLILLVAMYYFRPDIWDQPTWFRPQMWLTVAVGVGWLTHLKTFRFNLLMLLGTLVVGLGFGTSFFAAVDPVYSYDASIVVMKVAVLMLFTVNLVDTSEKLQHFFWANVLGMLWNLKTILITGIGGGEIRAQRVDVGVGQGGGANYIAMILAMTVPILYMRILNGRGRERTMAIMLIPLYILGLVVTGSRGGFLSAAAVALFLLCTSNKKILGFSLISVLFAFFMLVLPAAYVDRLVQGFGDSQTRDSSADSRLKLWQAGWTMFKEYPLHGVGLDNFSLLSPRYAGFYASKAMDAYVAGKRGAGFVAHSTWFQMLAEGGVLLSLPFFGMFFVTFRTLSRVKRANLPDPLKGRIREQATVLQGIFIAFIVSSTFGSHLKIDFMWWYFGAVGAMDFIVRDAVAKQEAGIRAARLAANRESFERAPETAGAGV